MAMQALPSINYVYADREGHILYLNAFMSQRGGMGRDLPHRPHEPSQQVDAVDRLVHQRSAAVKFPCAVP